MTFSDNESTGTESDHSVTGDETVSGGATDSGQDEAWLFSMIQPLDAWMRFSTPQLYHKWRAFSNLTMMYHRAARDLRADLENDELQLHLLKEMCSRMEAEKQSVQAMLARANQEKESAEARLAATEAAHARSDAVLQQVNTMVLDELHKWEMVDAMD